MFLGPNSVFTRIATRRTRGLPSFPFHWVSTPCSSGAANADPIAFDVFISHTVMLWYGAVPHVSSITVWRHFGRESSPLREQCVSISPFVRFSEAVFRNVTHVLYDM